MRRILYTLILSIILLSSLGSASALTNSPTGITISPASQNVTLGASDTQKTVNFTLTNNEPELQSIDLKTADFSSINYTGGLLFVGSSPSQLQRQDGLAKWLSLPQNSLTLAGGQKTQVSVVINNRSDLAPGGHYGALLIYINKGPTKTHKANQVGLQPVASSLMFVTKQGGATYKMALTKVSFDHNFFKLPSSVVLRFYDFGNTQVTPRGFITITNSKNQLIKKGVINLDSEFVLPGLSRDISVPLNSVKAANSSGSYNLNVYYRFDGYNQYRFYEAKINLGLPIKTVVIILLIILALGFFGLSYKQRNRSKKSF